MKTVSTTPKDFNDYLMRQQEEFRPMLQSLHDLVESLVPTAEESISYQVPCFKHLYMLVGIGVNKNYCSLYTMSPPLVKMLKEEHRDVKFSGATIHFSPEEPLPVALIRKIVKARIKENEMKYSQKGKM